MTARPGRSAGRAATEPDDTDQRPTLVRAAASDRLGRRAAPRPRAAACTGWAGRRAGDTRCGGLAQRMPPMVSSEMIVAPQPAAWTCSSAMTSRPVFSTEARTVGRSRGRSQRRSMTSASMPSAARSSAAASDALDHQQGRDDRHVGAGPQHRGLAELGRTSPRTTGPLRAYRPLCSKKRTGFGSCDGGAKQARRPSPGELAVTTRSPGRCMNQLSPVALCCVPKRPVAPPIDADRDRHGRLAAGHVAVLGQLVDDRVAGRRQEVGEHDLDDRAHARRGSCRARRPGSRSRRSAWCGRARARTSRPARCWS